MKLKSFFHFFFYRFDCRFSQCFLILKSVASSVSLCVECTLDGLVAFILDLDTPFWHQ